MSPRPSAPTTRRPTPLRALLHATFLRSLAYRDALIDLWSDGDSVMRLTARRLETDLHLDALMEWSRILLARYLLIPARRRPRYKGRLKLAILVYAERFSLPWAEVARDFGLRPSTIHRWLRQRRTHDTSRLLRDRQPSPPVRRFADSVRQLVADMKVAGFMGDGSIAGALRHKGWDISHDTVGRILIACGFPRPASRRGKLAAKRSLPRRAPRRCVTAQPTIESRTRARRIARCLVETTELLRRQMGEAVARWRRLLPQTRERQLGQVGLLRARHAEYLRILLAHMGCIDPHRRPCYTPEQRLAILAYKHCQRLSHEEVARRFLLHPNTVCEWNVGADEDPPPRRISPRHSIRSASAAVELALRTALRLRDDLRERLFALLLTLCAAIPMRRRQGRAATTEWPRATAGHPRPCRNHPIVALHPNHYWMADFTTFWQSDRPDFYLLTILDVFSRRTLAWQLFIGEPSAARAAALLRQATARHGKPRHFVSDKGAEFTSELFQMALADVQADHRIGAVGEKGSIAIIERFWLSLTTGLDTASCPPLIPDVLAERVGGFMHWYDHHRPHSPLGSATPVEVFTATPPAAAKSPPRGRPGQACGSLGLAIRFALPHEHRLPYLERVS